MRVASVVWTRDSKTVKVALIKYETTYGTFSFRLHFDTYLRLQDSSVPEPLVLTAQSIPVRLGIGSIIGLSIFSDVKVSSIIFRRKVMANLHVAEKQNLHTSETFSFQQKAESPS